MGGVRNTPPKINIKPENDGLVQMMFLFLGVYKTRFHVNLPVCIWFLVWIHTLKLLYIHKGNINVIIPTIGIVMIH